jgi:cell division protease FtsH
MITRMARAMVTQYGMSKKLGPLTFGDKEELVFLGRQLSEQRNYSEEVAEQIDFEVRRLVDEAHEQSLTLLKDNIGKLKLIALRLMEDETLDAEGFAALMIDDIDRGPGTSSSEVTTPQATPNKQGSAESEDTSPRRLPPSAAPLPA